MKKIYLLAVLFLAILKSHSLDATALSMKSVKTLLCTLFCFCKKNKEEKITKINNEPSDVLALKP